MAGKWLFPMLSLRGGREKGLRDKKRMEAHESLKPKVALDVLYVI